MITMTFTSQGKQPLYQQLYIIRGCKIIEEKADTIKLVAKKQNHFLKFKLPDIIVFDSE